MDIPSGGAVAGALRVGIQVMSNYRRPALEFYFDLHNNFGPEVRIPQRIVDAGAFKFTRPESSHRSQFCFVTFSVVNIGGTRAENVMLSISENVRPNRPIQSARFGTEIRQLAPGQRLFLFQLDLHDLFQDDQSCKFHMTAEYNGPMTGLNCLARIPSWLKRTKQYRTKFDFDAAVAVGDLPPPTYA